MHKRLVVCVDDFEGLALYRGAEHLLNGLLHRFDASDIGFTTPGRVLRRDGVLSSQLRQHKGTWSADALLIFGVNTASPRFSMRFLWELHAALAALPVRTYLNPLGSKRMLDKACLRRLRPDWFPEQMRPGSWAEIESHLNGRPLVLKHRAGAEGSQVHLITAGSLADVRRRIGARLPDYILQRYIDSVAEKRLMIFGNEVVGTRIKHRPNHPWDDPREVKPGYRKQPYTPTPEELECALELKDACGARYCAVDFLDDGRRTYALEINGICPGLIAPAYPDTTLIYDLRLRFADFVYEEIRGHNLPRST